MASELKENKSIYEWRPDSGLHNFGDYLGAFIGEKIFTSESWDRIRNNRINRYFLLGSVISNWHLRSLVRGGFRPVLIGCGFRGEALQPEIARECVFLGCRGFLTQAALAECGLAVDVIGDPGVLISCLVEKPRPSPNKIIFIPHCRDPQRYEYTIDAIGCEKIIQPEVCNQDELLDLISEISGAQFVLTGALHVAIVAHSYNVPFGFFGGNRSYIDCPVKWPDWMSSINDQPGSKLQFFQNVIDAQGWWSDQGKHLKQKPINDLLRAFETIGHIQPKVAERFLG